MVSLLIFKRDTVLHSIKWNIPQNVSFAISQRQHGFSQAPFHSLNLGLHVGDDPSHVLLNRKKVIEQYKMPTAPFWLTQVHGTDVIDLGKTELATNQHYIADASYTNQPQQVCVVMTADCLPLLLCNRQGTEIAAVHAGWKGLCQGIIENTIAKFKSAPKDILALTGPCIGANAFEVGAEVRNEFVKRDPKATLAFKAQGNNKYLANLPLLAEQGLLNCGVTAITHSYQCTYTNTNSYFSYRRENKTGRMASFIWIK